MMRGKGMQEDQGRTVAAVNRVRDIGIATSDPMHALRAYGLVTCWPWGAGTNSGSSGMTIQATK